jgi:SNF2 family DNA or RNA helicase
VSAYSLPPERGQLVHLRQRRWLVEGVEVAPRLGEATLVRAACVDDDAQGEPVSVLWEHELDARVIEDAGWRRIGEQRFDDTELFAAYARTVRWGCVTATDPTLFQAPFRAGIRLDAYQLEPLRKALLLPRVNLLIADDVGLGKTIEAGLILRELLLRRRVDFVVVAAPPSMLGQWADELETRFGLNFTIFDRAFLAAMRRERGFAVNPWTTGGRFLVSQRLLVDPTYTGGLIDVLREFRAGSLLILDEAHHAAPASGRKYAIDSQITRAIRDLAPRFEHRLFLTATPHNGHPNSFAALMEILDPQRFVRGVTIEAAQLEPVMVRRLKEDLRSLGQTFPERRIEPIIIRDLPENAPELVLAAQLSKYRDLRRNRLAPETASRRAQAELVWIGLQQRLLSSIEAFARTLAVHEASLRRAQERGLPTRQRVNKRTLALLTGIGADDDAAGLDEEALRAEEEQAVEIATLAGAIGAGARWNRQIEDELDAVAEMRRLAEASRAEPDARIEHLIEWTAREMVPGLRHGGREWTKRRLLLFTEYEDTRRWLERLLREAVAHTERADERIAVFSGSTPAQRREEIKLTFNKTPSDHPLRILIATDAAREGLNLQRHCCDLFHIDLPWNPSRLEQRNGRIDRKLQPAKRVYCRYFIYAQRPEDRVLKVLVEKTEVIRKQLGSASPVIETRIFELLADGIDRSNADHVAAEIDRIEQSNLERRARDDLEPVREADVVLARRIEQLRSQLQRSGRQVGVDRVQLQRVVTFGLKLAGAPPLHRAETESGARRFEFRPDEIAGLRDEALARTLAALRDPADRLGTGPLRPVSFDPPLDTDAETVQLHLEHPLVTRLIDRFSNQGLVHHELSRACLAVAPDAVPRVVLLGRLSLWGNGAARLHEEIVRVAARWVEPAIRKARLQPYSREAERQTMESLDRTLDEPRRFEVPPGVRSRLLAGLSRDVGDLLPELERRATAAAETARDRLRERGRAEAASLRDLIEAQRRRIERELGRLDDPQSRFDFDTPEERRQRELDIRAWHARLGKIDSEVEEQPARILAGYEVRAQRLEPVGIVYLWPATG